MKKITYTILIVFCTFIATVAANAANVLQTWTWTGSGDGTTWSSGSNWSASPVDANQTYPHNYNDALVNKNFIANVVFNVGATPSVDGTYFINTLVINSGTVNILSAGTAVRTLTIAWAATGAGLTVSSGATLQIGGGSSTGIYLSMGGTGSGLEVFGTIDGTLDIAGTGPTTGGNNPRFVWDSDFAAPYTKVTVGNGGKILMSGSNSVMTGPDKNKLVFTSGATMEITRSGGVVPDASYQTGSFLRIIGTGTSGAALQSNDATSVVYDCDILWDRSGQSGETSFNWPAKTPFGGTLTVKNGFLNIGGSSNTLMSNGTFTMNNIVVQGGALNLGSTAAGTGTITGTLDVIGGIFRIGNPPYSSNMGITVNGNVTQSGGTIDVGPNTGVNKLFVKSDLTQTGGTLTESSTSTGSALFFSGGNTQITTFLGTVSGNALNVEINKTANDVKLLTPLSIPKDLILTARNIILGANTLTVGNLATGGSLASHVVTDGDGALQLLNVGVAGKDFPVGFTTTNYDLVNVKNVMGINNFSVKVKNAITYPPPPEYFALPRQWDVSADAVPTNGATLSFTPTGVPTAIEPLIGHYNIEFWEYTSSLTTAPTYSDVFNSFSPFIVASLTPLPVELIAFNATKSGKTNLLTWKTASEKNNSHFDVEQSIDGENNWTTIGSVKGKGTSALANNYNFTDETPLSISYYRLKQMDFDGKAVYSKVVSVVGGKADKFKINSVSPNPFKDVATIVFDSNKEDNVTVTLMDVTGRVVLLKNVACTEGGNLLNLNTSALLFG